MGFVNPLKAFKMAHYDDVEGALMSIAKNALNRFARLILPGLAVTVIAWLFCQLGFFDLARETGAYWLQHNSPEPSESWSQAVWDLGQAIVDTWVNSENIYDQPQWALSHLLKGSMYIFLLLLITITATPRFRIYAILFAYGYAWISGDCLVGFNLAPGILLSELHISGVGAVESRHKRIGMILVAIFGLYIMSFPTEFQDWKPWTRHLAYIGHFIFPETTDMSRMWDGLGAQMFCFSVFFSPDLRRLFSQPSLTWLGSISFPLYLLHGTLMRTLLAWMAFGPQWLVGAELVDDKIPLPGAFTMITVMPVFIAVTLAVSALWQSKVEPYFGKATSLLQEFATGGGRRSPARSPILPTIREKMERSQSEGTLNVRVD
jgi:peptidoglycan/LPS O-acetylase OafA/YrhL